MKLQSLRRFDHHANSVWFHCIANGQGNLFRQPLLDLQAAAVDLHNPVQKRKISAPVKMLNLATKTNLANLESPRTLPFGK